MLVIRKTGINTKPEVPIRAATARELVDYNKAIRNISEKVLLSDRLAEYYFTPDKSSDNNTAGFVFTKQ